jgi:hypothetical protein
MPPGYALVFVELAVGFTSGWMVRVGLTAVDMLADVLSQQSGLSFAATLQHDANLASGLVGEFLGLLAIALAFTLNIHLVMLELLVNSFKVLPLGTWPAAWNWTAILGLVQDAFSLGLVLALPAIVIYFLFNMTQAILARVSPHTGRKHQIRAHALWLGHPVIGDKLYGGDDSLYLEFVEHGWTDRLGQSLELERQALHAARLDFRAPQFQRIFRAPLAPDMRAFILNQMGVAASELAAVLAV